MNRTLPAAVLVLLVLVGWVLWARRQRTPLKGPVIGDIEIVPESVSQARAARVLPMKGSEDAARLLQPIIVAPRSPSKTSNSYPPDPRVDWVVEVELPSGILLTGKEVRSAFDPAWLKMHGGAVLHGFAPSTKTWTYVGAGDAPEPYSKLAFGKSLVHTDGLTGSELSGMLGSIEAKAHAWPGAVVSCGESPVAAAKRALTFANLRRNYGVEAVIVLKAPTDRSFDGREIWDVMLSLGLRWGDMDLFHWSNSSGAGDSYWFSVSTSTPPGYFLPEAIAAGNVHVNDLVFSFSVPRCAAPAESLERMHAAAKYARVRLGGELRDAHDRPFNVDAVRAEVVRVGEALTAAGFPPGAGSTLQLF